MMGRLRICNTTTKSKESTMNQTLLQTFDVQGMTCGHCERAVTQAVKSVDPQSTVKIDRASGRVDVQSTAPREALAAAIAEEGYKVAT
jgi:copper chaperone